ncbi:arylsulfatase I-like [Physella acuta]|uniref:arylsulfatase I-like n=1 Tax=Physella acuta TaxID=109671 RepID=UPI0027DBBD27|nr:arylsulfatase I-like [Physella acuta]
MLQQLLILTFGLCACLAKTPLPHVVFIVADDFGYNDIGYNNPEIISPNLDQLANTGIKLNQSYVQPLCTPSRTAFMTGIYPFRLGLQHLVIGSKQSVCVPQNKTFLPEVLKAEGYTTHIVGKWHLGYCNLECTPTYRGFDTFYGFYSGGEDHYQKTFGNGFDFRFNTSVDREATGGYSAEQFASRAVDIIESHDPDTPLYLYLPFQSVHMPLQVPERYLNLYPNVTNQSRKELSAMVSALDEAVGRVVAALKTNGLYNDTLIIFTSDNGGWTPYGGNNYPLRGGKMSVFEGGTRVPAFLHGPMLEKSESTYNGIFHAVDWFATILGAAGINYTDPDQDGTSQWDSLNFRGAPLRSEFVYNLDYHILPLQGQSAIRVGDFKLILGYPGLYQSWYQPDDKDQGLYISLDMLEKLNVESLPGEVIQQVLIGANDKLLFNLKDDPNEHNNIYDQHPDIVSQLTDRLEAYKRGYVDPNFPPSDPRADPSNYGGVWSPGWC